MTLYELSEELMQLLEMAEDPDVDQETLYDTFDAVEGEFEIKADGYGMVIAELKARAEMFNKEAERMAAKAKVMENNADRIKKRLEAAMLLTGNTKFEAPHFKFWIQKNAPSLVIDDREKIPAEFLIPQDPKVDNAAIKKMLKEKQVDWAHMVQSESIRIR